MSKALKTVTYILTALAVCTGLIASDIAAFAQSASCSQLNNSLNALDRNKDFRSMEQNAQSARELADQIRGSESQFVRKGCQKVLNSGKSLPRECRDLARTIINGRKDYSRAAASVETGKAVAQQREVTLQEIARFGCRNKSSAVFTQEERPTSRSPFEDLLTRLFGGGSGESIRDEAPDYFNQSTLRTVCVRACDGYYWPVSFSTVSDYLGKDDASCQAQAGDGQVELYYYSNPGEDADSMVNLQGMPYKSHPNAFLYRREYNPECRSKPAIDYGSIQLSASIEGQKTRAEIVFGNASFPLPMRDPRRTSEIVVKQALYMPLPRPRPIRNSEAPQNAATTKPVTRPVTDPNQRVIMSGKRRVRIVGPDTPFVQAAAKGS